MNLLKPIDLNKLLSGKEQETVVENKTLTDIYEKIKNAEKIVIFTHESPDGDAIGSTLSVYLALKQIGKKPTMYIPEHSRMFDFLPGADEIKTELRDNDYDLAIALDCSDLVRLEGKEYFENITETIVIDHHGTNNMFGDINYVDHTAPACAQVLISILEYFNIDITKDIGTCLLTGILTDTGGFRYQGITAETFEFAADLLRKGVDIPELSTRVLQTRTKANFELSKRVTDRLELLADGKIAFSYITTKDEEEVNAEPGDHEGLVDIGRSIEGVEISIFLRQKEGEEAYKVSMRSTNYVNVSDICYLFGGGGHQRAAGCLLKNNLKTAKHKIVSESEKALKEQIKKG